MKRDIQIQSPPAHSRGCNCGRVKCKNAGQKQRRRSRSRWADHTDFVMIDGEGVTIYAVDSMGVCEKLHIYSLLSVGDQSIINRQGLQWSEICEFLYEQFEQTPKAVFGGFYLGYDFTQWVKTLPEDRARMLLTQEGIAARRHRNGPVPHPVEYDGWQFDILGSKRLKLRPKRCPCTVVTCKCKKPPWMYVCDTGPFWQTSFLQAINPEKWDNPIVTPEEYEKLREGKDKRSSAHLDKEMIGYNLLENQVGTRLCHELDVGFRALDVVLKPSQWIGPGQAAQEWMKGQAPTSAEIRSWVPQWFLDATIASYFGGWFEIFAHGPVPGISHEYDINSAYPFTISQLPCLQHGKYSRGEGKPAGGERDLVLVYARVWSHKSNERSNLITDKRYVGAMMHRSKEGRISRPQMTEGWFWWDELQAAVQAKCVVQPRASQISEWVKYEPCDCKEPMWRIKNLYERRIQVGKNTPLGKGCRLIANSIYGKTAQSIGAPMFANPVYASRITSRCRTMILDAIATHPGGQRAVVMVATDGVYFRGEHPGLTVNKELGGWEHGTKQNLTLFKPGVYWDDATREAIREGKAPQFKARGVNARYFSAQLQTVDEMFAAWDGIPPGEGNDKAWPSVRFTCDFAMTTALQALVRGSWQDAGRVGTFEAQQNSDPYDKRCGVYWDTQDGLYRSEPHFPAWSYNPDRPEESDYMCVSHPYEKRFGMDDPWSQVYTESMGMTPDGPVGFMLHNLIGG